MARRRPWHIPRRLKMDKKASSLRIALLLFTLCNATSSVDALQDVSQGMQVLPIDVPFPPSELASFRATANNVFGTVDEISNPIVPFDPAVETIVLDGADAYSAYSFAFQTEELRNISDYTIEIECSNHAVIESEDVLVGPPVLMENGRANFTATIAFERAVGETDVVIIFRRSDNSIYAKINVHYIVCGISFYHFDKETEEKALIVNNVYRVTDAAELMRDDIVVFFCFIQYPDGSTSESIGEAAGGVPDISTMKVSVEKNELLSSHSFDSCLVDHATKQPNGTVTLDQHCSFGFTRIANEKGPYYAVRVLKQRVGVTRFHFQWDNFLRGTTLEETFETTLAIQVVGEVTPSVISITPGGPFQKSGGQLVHCAVINAHSDHTYKLSILDTTLSSVTFRKSSQGWSILSFIMPPGEGRNIPWDLTYSEPGSKVHLSCPWGGDSKRFAFHYLAEDISILSLSPNHGPVAGGTTVTCHGHFGAFKVGLNSGDVVMLGAYALEAKYIISVTETSIAFRLPPMSVSGSPSFHVGCYVISGGIRSNIVDFTYQSLTETSIEISGASYDDRNNTHRIPICGVDKKSSEFSSVTLFAKVNPGAPTDSLTFKWHVVILSTRAEVVSTSGAEASQSLVLEISKLSLGETYEAIVVVSDSRYNSEVTSSTQMSLSGGKILGLDLSLDDSRTIALPPVNARITATVNDLEGCHGKGKILSFDWTYLGIEKSLSSSSTTVEVDNPSPRRLGREYIIPRNGLKYGKHKVEVKAYYTEEPEIFGTSSAWFTVTPATLQAVIGSGESLVRASGSSDLIMDASRSHDPDETVGEIAGSLKFIWSCEISTEGEGSFVLVSECPQELLPSQTDHKFTIAQQVLRDVRFSTGSTFVRYTLYVQKIYENIGVRSSERVSQVVEILESDEKLAISAPLSVSGTDGRSVHLGSVPFYEPLIISPFSKTGTSWRFQMLAPSEDSFTFLKNPANLVSLPGFYDTNEFIARRRSLGIQAGALKPDTEYAFEIQYESKDADSPRAVEVTLRTMPKPLVSFSLLSEPSGTTGTIFSAMATSSMESVSFKYYFHIGMGNGTEMCIDGCGGHRRVSFRIPIAGTHTIRCTMVDARGRFVITTAEQTQEIVIRESHHTQSPIVHRSDALQQSFNLGDHSSFTLECLGLAVYAQKISARDTVVSTQTAELVSTSLAHLVHMYANTQPNTALGRDFLHIAHAFAALPAGHEAMSYTPTFYHLCRLLFYAVHNTPVIERFDLTELLTSSLTHLAKHARQLHSGGSSRERLTVRQTGGSYEGEVKEVNEELLQVNELVVPLTARVLSRGEPCGYEHTHRLEDLATLSVTVRCNAEQGLELPGEHSRLQWCREVFKTSGPQRRLLFALGEFSDYIGESGVLVQRPSITRTEQAPAGSVAVETRNMASHAAVLSKTLVVDADSRPPALGSPDSAAGAAGATADRDVPRAADAVAGSNGTCFGLEQSVRATAALFNEYEEVLCRSTHAVEYTQPMRLTVGLSRDAYSEAAVGTTGRVHARAESSSAGKEGGAGEQSEGRIRTQLRRVSGRTFGVKRAGCRDVRPTLFGVVVGVWLPFAAVFGTLCVVIVGGVVGGRGVLARERAKAWADGGDGPYIERDVYGRDVGDFGGGGLEVEGEEVVFENRTPRVVAGRTNDGREVGGLFRAGER